MRLCESKRGLKNNKRRRKRDANLKKRIELRKYSKKGTPRMIRKDELLSRLLQMSPRKASKAYSQLKCQMQPSKGKWANQILQEASEILER